MTLNSLPITFLLYPVLVLKLYFDPHPKRFFFCLQPCMRPVPSYMEYILLCQVTQNFHIQPLPYNLKDSKLQGRYTPLFQIEKLCFSTDSTITHCSSRRGKKKIKHTLFSSFVIFLQSNPRMVITQMHQHTVSIFCCPFFPTTLCTTANLPGCWRAEWGITQATYWENCHAAGKRARLAFPWILMAAAQANHQEHIILQLQTAEHTGAGRAVIASKGKIKIGLGKQRWH